jgi:hypothetical protein
MLMDALCCFTCSCSSSDVTRIQGASGSAPLLILVQKGYWKGKAGLQLDIAWDTIELFKADFFDRFEQVRPSLIFSVDAVVYVPTQFISTKDVLDNCFFTCAPTHPDTMQKSTRISRNSQPLFKD